MRHRMLAMFLVVILFPACERTAPGPLRELWVADLLATKQVLKMKFTVNEGIVVGTGALSHLVEAPEPLAVRGRRTPDSLYVTFARVSIPAFTFTGEYGPRLSGILHGSEFDSLRIGFRRQ
ncbi:MAG: hypothetical protein ACREOK_01985 [Gemmatimonadaceae bacterium]